MSCRSSVVVAVAVVLLAVCGCTAAQAPPLIRVAKFKMFFTFMGAQDVVDTQFDFDKGLMYQHSELQSGGVPVGEELQYNNLPDGMCARGKKEAGESEYTCQVYDCPDLPPSDEGLIPGNAQYKDSVQCDVATWAAGKQCLRFAVDDGSEVYHVSKEDDADGLGLVQIDYDSSDMHMSIYVAEWSPDFGEMPPLPQECKE